jgi:hypothetical protein
MILAYYNLLATVMKIISIWPGLHEGQDEWIGGNCGKFRLPLHDAYQMIFTGEIQDGKSIIGLQYACQNK